MNKFLSKRIIFNKIRSLISSGDERTVSAKKNIVFSFGNKLLSIIINLMLVPLTIHFINAEQYGIWLTISSVIQWISFFDFGLGHGFRNKFAAARAENNIILARQYVSTTYLALAAVFGAVLILFSIINIFIDWSQLLNLPATYKAELSRIVYILVFFLCVQLVVSVLNTLLLADHKAALSSFIVTLGQLGVLIFVFILTFVSEGDLFSLAIISSIAPVIIIIIFSIVLFRGKYREISPSINYLNFKLIKDILGLGGKFFIIQICMLFIFQFSNLILARLEGPLSVTQYNITNKYFSVLYMVFIIILTPFWSAFTDAYTKRDFNWMNKVYNRLNKLAFLSIPLSIIMAIISPYVFDFWIGKSKVNIPFELSVLFAVYIITLVYGNLYMYLINGTGKVLLQTYIYIFFAIISVPLSIFLCRIWGVKGVVIVPIIVYFAQNIFGYFQLKKILSNRDSGIWSK